MSINQGQTEAAAIQRHHVVNDFPSLHNTHTITELRLTKHDAASEAESAHLHAHGQVLTCK